MPNSRDLGQYARDLWAAGEEWRVRNPNKWEQLERDCSYPLAVYGTLRDCAGMGVKGRHPLLIGNGILYGSRDQVAGRLYLVDGILPAIRLMPQSDNRVVVDVFHQLTPSRLFALDMMEGYCPDSPETSHYRRVKTRLVNHANTNVWIYEYVPKLRVKDILPRGDYRAAVPGLRRIAFVPEEREEGEGRNAG